MGLSLKTFKLDQTHHHGDYVFSKSSRDNHDSMFIAEKTFVAAKKPYLDLDSGNWVEFHAPRGEQGAAGPKGEPGTVSADTISIVKKQIVAKTTKEVARKLEMDITKELKESVDDSALQKQLERRQQDHSGSVRGIGAMMKAKPKSKAKETCTGGAEFGPIELNRTK